MKFPKHLLTVLLAILFLQCSKDSKNDAEEQQQSTTDNHNANLKASGDSAKDLLANANFDDLLIQMAYVKDHKPTQNAVDDLVDFLSTRTYKQNITIQYKELASPGKDSLSLQDVVDLEQKNRTAFNSGRTIAVYIYFADAPSEDDDGDKGLVTLGAVYRNTSMVIYEDTVRRLAANSYLIDNEDVEAATLSHEFGHLFGLVNLGTAPVNPHVDPESKSHCSEDNCLMRAELEFGAPMAKFLEKRASKGLASVPDLGPECILDLQSVGGK